MTETFGDVILSVQGGSKLCSFPRRDGLLAEDYLLTEVAIIPQRGRGFLTPEDVGVDEAACYWVDRDTAYPVGAFVPQGAVQALRQALQGRKAKGGV